MIKNIFLVLFVFVTGCQAFTPFSLLPLGVNTVLYWKNGEAKKYYNTQLDLVDIALDKSIKELHHTIDSPSTEGKVKKFISHSEHHKFKWEVSQYDPEVVCVKCRIDFWGDKEYVELIYRKLDAKLGFKTDKIVDNSTHRRWIRRAK